MISTNRPINIAMPSAMFMNCVFAVMPANAEPLLLPAEVNAYSTSVKPCGPGFQIDTLSTLGRHDRDPRTHEHRERHRDGVEHDELDLGRLDLLAEVLRRATDHQAGDEDGEQREDQDPVEPDADAARAHLAELHVEERHHAAERRVAVVHRVDRAGRRTGRRGGEDRRAGDAVADLLALGVAARLGGGRGLVDAERARPSGCRSPRTACRGRRRRARSTP